MRAARGELRVQSSLLGPGPLIGCTVAHAATATSTQEDARSSAVPHGAHWECWCVCVGTGHGPVVFELPGKCDGSENGSGCVVEGDAGTLTWCVSVAEQDE